ncbi:MAG: AAA family ATPase [Clostridia bacterium]|nr:AAA family ATPase [Clostridia bacterium]
MAERITVLSGKGGAGKSTCCVLIGKALVACGKKVLLADCDIGLRALDIFTGAQGETVYHWGDVLLGRCDAADAVVHCSAGFDLLSAPSALDDALTEAGFRGIINALDSRYDVILIDGPAGIGQGLRLAAAPSQKALLVSAPDDVSLCSCAAAAKELETACAVSTRLIINHFRFKAVRKSLQKNIDDSIDKAGARLIGIIPEDPNLWYFGSGGMLPKAQSPAIDACARIAARLLGRNLPLKVSALK